MDNFQFSLNLSMSKEDDDNTTLFNTTGSTTPPGDEVTRQGLSPKHANSISIALFFATRIPLAVFALVLNFYLLRGLSMVKHSDLKAKTFLQAMGVTNASLPVIATCELNMYATLFGNVDPNIDNCFFVVYQILYSYIHFAHSVSGLGLALDRVYAILSPIKYRTIGYSATAKGAMVISLVLIPPILICAIILPHVDTRDIVPHGFSPFCLYTYNAHHRGTFPLWAGITLLILSVTCFSLYMFILAVVRYQAKISMRMRSEGSQNSMKLFGAYLFSNVTTLLFYAPGPLLMFANDSMPRLHFFLGMRLTVAFYMFNSSLNPIILIYRIPSIRQTLPFDINFNSKHTNEKSQALTKSSALG